MRTVAGTHAALMTADLNLLASSQAAADAGAGNILPCISCLWDYLSTGLEPNSDFEQSLANYLDKGMEPGDLSKGLETFFKETFKFNPDAFPQLVNLFGPQLIDIAYRLVLGAGTDDLPLVVESLIAPVINVIFAEDSLPVRVTNAIDNPPVLLQVLAEFGLLFSNDTFAAGADSIPSVLLKNFIDFGAPGLIDYATTTVTDLLFTAGANSIPSGALQAFFEGYPLNDPAGLSGFPGVASFLFDGVKNALYPPAPAAAESSNATVLAATENGEGADLVALEGNGDQASRSFAASVDAPEDGDAPALDAASDDTATLPGLDGTTTRTKTPVTVSADSAVDEFDAELDETPEPRDPALDVADALEPAVDDAGKAAADPDTQPAAASQPSDSLQSIEAGSEPEPAAALGKGDGSNDADNDRS